MFSGPGLPLPEAKGQPSPVPATGSSGMTIQAVQLFIGSGEASRLERKVLQYSLRKNSKRDLRVFVFNGTHNAVEPPTGEPFPAPMSLKAKYTNVTEFSNYRFLIPQLCNYEGRAIYLDSDMVALAD